MRDFAPENKGYCVLKFCARMNVGTGTGTGIELPCKYYLYASKKYKHNMRNATIKKQCSYDRSSDGFLQMRFRGLIFGRACFFFSGGGGGRIIGIIRCLLFGCDISPCMLTRIHQNTVEYNLRVDLSNGLTR